MAAIAIVVIDCGGEGQGGLGTQESADEGARARARPARARWQGWTRARGQGQGWTWWTTMASNKSGHWTKGRRGGVALKKKNWLVTVVPRVYLEGIFCISEFFVTCCGSLNWVGAYLKIPGAPAKNIC